MSIQPSFPIVYTGRDKETLCFAQALATWFWRRWMRMYVPNLNERRKRLAYERNLHVGDVVILIGRVTKVLRTSDLIVLWDD